MGLIYLLTFCERENPDAYHMHPDPDFIPYCAATASNFSPLKANTLYVCLFYIGSKHRFLGFPQKSGAPPDPVCEKDVRLHVVLPFSIQLLRTPLEYIYRNSVDRTNRRINPGCIFDMHPGFQLFRC